MRLFRRLPEASRDSWSFTVERLQDDLYAWSSGRDTSLETKESLQELLQNKLGGTNELGGPALDGDRGKDRA